ncbi:GATA zinc finger domain-containing protein 14 [Culicoides brevitarsis]|uniref:GATA zinc finger domain-containing protein 14 n=1 Tax=Culicoides brevitarsis TaxID=469753 RepID=UPI00307BE735
MFFAFDAVGQSDIKKLKKENEQLRREIWTLRDEYDKLEKLLASKVNLDCDEDSHDSESCHSHDSDGSCQTCGSCNNTETTNDTSQHNGGHQSVGCKAKKEKLHVEFDHLSIVSEESQRSPNEDSANRLAVNEPKVQPKAPESPFPLTELQSLVPPLTHFENLPYESIGGNVDEDGFIIPNTKVLNEEPSKWSNSSNKPDILLQQSSSASAQVTPSDPVSSFRNFQTGGNLDELLQDIEFLSKDIEDLQNKNKSDTSLNNCSGSKKKPFRSEVSLVLDFPNNNNNNNSLSTQIETKPIIHPVPPDDLCHKLPSPPILKESHNRSSTGFEHSHTNGTATPTSNNMEVRSPTQNTHIYHENERKLSSSESTLAKSSSKSGKRVSLSLGVGKKTNRFKKHDAIEKASHASRRMSLDLDLSPTHAPHPNTHHNDSRRHSCDSNKSHHKKRSRSDSINSRGTYTTEPSSQRRISVTSYQSSKKIPWCGCWGLC